MTKIHPSAVISRESEIAPGVEIGPGCVLEGNVKLAEGVRLVASVFLKGPISIGPRTIVWPLACLGYEPQDMKFKLGEPTPGVKIGADCLIREHVTIHAASTGKDRPTTIGDRCFLMVNSHMGHDALVGNDVTMVNNTALGGHASVGDKATLGGLTAVHQFGRIGRYAFLSGGATLTADVPPYCTAYGRNVLAGLNLVGMRRAGIPREQITQAREAFRLCFRSGMQRGEMVPRLRELGAHCPPVMEMADFVASCTRTIAVYDSRSRGEHENDALPV